MAIVLLHKQITATGTTTDNCGILPQASDNISVTLNDLHNGVLINVGGVEELYVTSISSMTVTNGIWTIEYKRGVDSGTIIICKLNSDDAGKATV